MDRINASKYLSDLEMRRLKMSHLLNHAFPGAGLSILSDYCIGTALLIFPVL
jgi:hypothetical protein